MSAFVEEAACAKINLTLSVTGRRQDGYHDIRSVMHTVGLCDRVTLRPAAAGIRLRLSDPSLPADERNTAYAAARRFLQADGCPLTGVEIDVEKRIPQQAGLAGGSADAAAVLRGMNRLCGCPLTAETLCRMGAAIGADVPFCVRGGAALATGIGDRLTPLPPLPEETWLVIVKPPAGVSTAAAYAAVDGCAGDIAGESAAETALLGALRERDLRGVGAALFNAFERALRLPAVTAVRRRLEDCAPLGVCMTGSGSAVYALFSEERAARRCAAAAAGLGETFVCRPA